jgi:hypothetical protein
MTENNPPKILFFDIETTPLKAYIWRLGKQVLRHDQLIEGADRYDIICITYCYNDGQKASVLHWDYEKQDSKPMLKEFDRLIKDADIVIGKNSDMFDNRHLNVHRMLNNHQGMPDWIKYTDDLEKQMRKHFGKALPSQSLDYISRILGYGGKVKMEFQDWINIVEKVPGAGLKSFNKMLKYGMKDVEDTRAIWTYMEKHITPKHSRAAVMHNMVCVNCGSSDIVKDGKKCAGGTMYQRFFCNTHGGYAGRVPIKTHSTETQMKG